jgi:hypothetical protein
MRTQLFHQALLDAADPMERHLLSFGLTAADRPTAISLSVSYAAGPEHAWRSIRKSYRPLINAGRQAFTRTVSTGCPTSLGEVIDFFAQANNTYANHGVISHFLNRVEQGVADAFTYDTHEGRVGFAVCERMGSGILYSLGCYRKDTGIPCHFMLHDIIEYYRGRNFTEFVLSPLIIGDRTDKQAGIDFFKAGYATDIKRQPCLLIAGAVLAGDNLVMHQT